MKKFLQITAGAVLLLTLNQAQARTLSVADTSADGTAERQYFIKTLTKIADPVLIALSKNELKKTMPVEAKVPDHNKLTTHLEAFGRLLSGMAPWLELGPDQTPEGQLRKKYIDLAVAGLKNATDPNSPDFMNFKEGRQPVVDAAFLAQALIRAPHQLWDRLDSKSQANVINALRSSRVILPSYSNWVLFSAMVETALQKFDHSGDKMRLDYAVRSIFLWYKGDGAYGDGPNFHYDYYNSFVIQPMLIEVTQAWAAEDKTQQKNYDQAVAHAQRYAEVQERLISPEGTYPPIGRSLAYRFGVFQLLQKVALMHGLDSNIKPQQVRAAMYAVVKRQIEAPDTFDKNGWLKIGIYGHQPGIGESYISTGSLYLCSEGFLILGLPASDPLWQGPDKDWTAKKVWKGLEVPIDHAENETANH